MALYLLLVDISSADYGTHLLLSAMVSALGKSEHDPDSELDLLKASEKLRKALDETDLRSLLDSMLQKTRADMYASKDCLLDSLQSINVN